MSLQNSFQLTETISNGNPCLHNHLEKSAEATVGALLSRIATSSAYFENASLIHNMNFSPEGIVFNGPHKSIWILWFGSEHWGKGLANVVLPFLSFLVLWHLSQIWSECLFQCQFLATIWLDYSFLGLDFAFMASHNVPMSVWNDFLT